jgi:hypothetical protein
MTEALRLRIDGRAAKGVGGSAILTVLNDANAPA